MAGRRAYAPVMHAELGFMEFAARRFAIGAASRGGLARRPVLGPPGDGRDPRRARPARLQPVKASTSTSRWPRSCCRRRNGPRSSSPAGPATCCTSSAASTRRCSGSATAPSCTSRAIRCRAFRHGARRWSAPISSPTNGSRRREARHAQPRRDDRRSFRSSRRRSTASTTSKPRSARVVSRSARCEPLTDVNTAAWAQAREALVDVGDARADRCALPRSPFRFSAATAGTAGRPGVARAAQPRGASRRARPERRRDRSARGRRRARQPPASNASLIRDGSQRSDHRRRVAGDEVHQQRVAEHAVGASSFWRRMPTGR